jgi:menaquinone-dependent protoporphyrinogen IX oxidase
MSKVLFVYFTYSQQTGKAAEAMAETLKARGHQVAMAAIEFTDHRYSQRFSHWPMRYPIWKIVGMLPAQLRRKTGSISIPAEARDGDYDLIVIGSPTWWLTTNMPIRSYLKDPAARNVLGGKPFAAFTTSRRYWKGNIKTIRKLGGAHGGSWRGQTHFLAEGNQVMSMASWLVFMRHGSARERAFGLKLPRPNLQPGYEKQAYGFIDDLADRVFAQPRAVGG